MPNHANRHASQRGDEEGATAGPAFVSLYSETRAAVDTATAAYHLNRQPQTLRGWACNEDGPLRPLRINGRLAWPVAELRRVLGVAQ
ncbi:MAG: DNA-binding protein [Betaproteobacteria bacterium]|nr:DNA-binding protein [Betaproteobacteria bacterium]